MRYQRHIASLTGAMLLAGSMLFAASADAKPIGEYEEVYPIYHDKRSGDTFYQLYDRGGKNGSVFAVIYADRQGQWNKLPYVSIMHYPYLFFKPYTDSVVYIPSDKPVFYNKSFMYDPTRHTLVDGQAYTMSPTGKSGYLQIEHYVPVRNADSGGFTPRRGTTLLLKDMTTGVIHELWSGRGFLHTSYTNDGRLLVSTGGKVYIADTATFKLKPIAEGSLYYYADTTNEAVITQPGSAKLLVYRVNDGTIRAIGSNDPRPKSSNMNIGFPPRSWPVPSSTLEVDTLPVTPLAAEYQPEAQLTLDGEYGGGMWKTAAPLAFIGADQTTYVPVAPFVEQLGLQVQKIITSRSESVSYRFKLSLQHHVLTVDDTNSRVVNYRLYVSPSLLKRLGMGDVSIDWNAPAVPIALEDAK